MNYVHLPQLQLSAQPPVTEMISGIMTHHSLMLSTPSPNNQVFSLSFLSTVMPATGDIIKSKMRFCLHEFVAVGKEQKHIT